MDLLAEVSAIVREAIVDGLITSLSVSEFDDHMNNLSGNAVEDFLQTLWDDI